MRNILLFLIDLKINYINLWLNFKFNSLLIMTREEQIIEAGIEYTMQNNPVCIGGDNFYE